MLLDKISLMRYHSADSVAVAVTDTLKAAEKDTLNVKKEPENIDKDSLESDKKELNAVPRMRPKPSSTLVQPQKQWLFVALCCADARKLCGSSFPHV